MSVDLPTLRGIATVLLLIAFLGIVAWAWSSKRKSEFEQAANLPLGNDERPGGDDSDRQA
jgi:cytochrome c oxidase cbb3-type subunit 4